MTYLASQISLLLCFLCFCPGYHVTCALPAFSHRSCAPRTQRTHMHSVTDFPRFCCSICPGIPGGDRSPSRATRPKAWVLLARWPQGPMQVISVKSDRAARSSNDSIICMRIISIIVIIVIIIIIILDDCRQSLQRHRFRLVGAGSSRSSSCHDIADG